MKSMPVFSAAPLPRLTAWRRTVTFSIAETRSKTSLNSGPLPSSTTIMAGMPPAAIVSTAAASAPSGRYAGMRTTTSSLPAALRALDLGPNVEKYIGCRNRDVVGHCRAGARVIGPVHRAFRTGGNDVRTLRQGHRLRPGRDGKYRRRAPQQPANRVIHNDLLKAWVR